MKPSVLGALLGALAGFTTVILLNLFVIPASAVRAILFPGNIFIRYATHKGVSDFGLMIYDSLAYFTNIVLYAAVGFGLGKLFESNRTNAPAEQESPHD